MCVWTGVAGPSGSGKSSLCVNIQKRLEEAGVHPSSIAQLSFDSYYKGLEGRDPTDVNFDVPSALDTDLLAQHLKELRVRPRFPLLWCLMFPHRYMCELFELLNMCDGGIVCR